MSVSMVNIDVERIKALDELTESRIDSRYEIAFYCSYIFKAASDPMDYEFNKHALQFLEELEDMEFDYKNNQPFFDNLLGTDIDDIVLLNEIDIARTILNATINRLSSRKQINYPDSSLIPDETIGYLNPDGPSYSANMIQREF